MNELTLSLLAIGLGLIVLLVVFNWWQERKIRKLAETPLRSAATSADIETNQELIQENQLNQDDELIGEDKNTRLSDRENDSLLKDEVDFSIDINGISPEAQPVSNNFHDTELAESQKLIQPSEEVAPAPYISKTLPEALSIDVDLIALISLPDAEKGERLRQMFMRLIALDKPVHAFGLNEQNNWQSLNREQESELFNSVAYSIQLADRAGAVSENTLKRFQSEISTISDELGGSLDWIGASDPINFAKDLDAFCLEVDQLVKIHLVNGASGRFMGSKFNSLCESNGVALKESGAFQATNDSGQVLFELINLEKNPFNPEMLKTSTLKGATFQMDIARTPDCTETFNRMVSIAKNMTSALNGALVDDHQHELSDGQLEKIRQQLKLIEVQMTVRGIVPGTLLALRLFS